MRKGAGPSSSSRTANWASVTVEEFAAPVKRRASQNHLMSTRNNLQSAGADNTTAKAPASTTTTVLANASQLPSAVLKLLG